MPRANCTIFTNTHKVKKANGMMGLIRRTFSYLDATLLKSLSPPLFDRIWNMKVFLVTPSVQTHNWKRPDERNEVGNAATSKELQWHDRNLETFQHLRPIDPLTKLQTTPFEDINIHWHGTEHGTEKTPEKFILLQSFKYLEPMWNHWTMQRISTHLN